MRAFLERNAIELCAKPSFEEIASALERLSSEAETQYTDLEQLEPRLTALEKKTIALARPPKRR